MEDIRVGQRYRHYKGKEYTILGIGHHSETLEKFVIYQGEYTDSTFGDRPIWIRPFEMFFEEIENKGIKTKRFMCILDNKKYD